MAIALLQKIDILKIMGLTEDIKEGAKEALKTVGKIAVLAVVVIVSADVLGIIGS